MRESWSHGGRSGRGKNEGVLKGFGIQKEAS